MNARWKIVCLSGTWLVCTHAMSLNAQPQKNTPQSAQKSWMQDQNDQTDIYAIPLDSSEEEEEEEEKALQNKQKKLPKQSK